ncbi:hypothetical protein HDU77_010014 [Chytriomyces hyalinus]|nr:hypothetical protein HDU77_010014 [Chytriomyces hyalinus]
MDAKYFSKGKVQEFRDELSAADRRDTKHTKKRIVLKKIVANMTMGNDMSPLFADVVAVMQTPMLEVKKMAYLYVVSYARTKPDLAKLTIAAFERDLLDTNPLIRALALRNMSYIQVDKVIDAVAAALVKCLADRDAYVAKTAAVCVVKMYSFDKGVVERNGFIEKLRSLLNSDNSMVVANAVAALTEIAEKNPEFDMRMDFALTNKLLTAINECGEWGQVYILESLLYFVPQDHNDAELVAERVMPRLQHANSAVVLSAIRLILYMTNYILKDELVATFYRRIGPPLVTLLHNGPEVQFVALRNIQLILQRKPDFLKSEIKVFFAKYNDPVYVKIAKLEIMFRLVSDLDVDAVLNELKEYATEVDVDFVRRSIRAIGKCAIKIESAADRCVKALVELIKTKVNYVVQESVIVIKDIFRRYPNKYEGIITTLCENLDSLDESEAKASMIWIIGHYSDRIENAQDLLSHFLEPFKDETPNVQLALLTAIVKLFIKRPTQGQELIPKVLKWSTEDVDNPDLRDRGFIYWRLLSTDPVAAKAIVFGDVVPVTSEMDNLPNQTLEELFLHISTLASMYHKTPEMFVGGLRKKKVEPSAAFVFRDFSAYRGHMDEDVFARKNAIENPNQNGMFGDEQQQVNPYAHGGVNAFGGGMQDNDDEDDGPDVNATPVVNSGALEITQQPVDPLYSNQFEMFLNSLANAPAPPPPQPSTDATMLLAGLSIGNNSPFGNNATNNSSAVDPNYGFSQPVATGPIFGRGSTADPNSGAYATTSGGLVELDPFGPSKQAAAVSPVQTAPPPVSTPQYGMGVNPMNSMYAGGASNLMTPSTPLQSAPLSKPAMNQMSFMSQPSSGPPSAQGYVPAATILLDFQTGKGLEIMGTFSRRAGGPNGRVYMDMAFTNKTGSSMLSDFAILFNRNAFGLSPAEPLNVSALAPGASGRTSLALKMDANAATPSNPVNNLQIAVKCNLGILYFQAQIPLHVLFSENISIEPEAWLRAWTSELPPSTESVANFQLNRTSRFTSPSDVEALLRANAMITVAQRNVEGNHVFFTYAQVSNGVAIYSEIKLDPSYQYVMVSTKSLGAQFIPAFESAVNGILNA